jgi:hypothetical protein
MRQVRAPARPRPCSQIAQSRAPFHYPNCSRAAREERPTAGAGENAQLLHDPASGVDVAFLPGGVVRPQNRGTLVMLASLYYEPLWVFYRGPGTLTELTELRDKGGSDQPARQWRTRAR